MHFAHIEIEPVILLVGSEEQIDAAVVVEITCSYASAVVIVHIVEYIECIVGMQGITEIDACDRLVEGFEDGRGYVVPAGGKAQQDKTKRKKYGAWELFHKGQGSILYGVIDT